MGRCLIWCRRSLGLFSAEKMDISLKILIQKLCGNSIVKAHAHKGCPCICNLSI